MQFTICTQKGNITLVYNFLVQLSIKSLTWKPNCSWQAVRLRNDLHCVYSLAHDKL